MKRSQVLLPAVIALLALALSGCGGSPTSPSGMNSGVTLHGLALGQGTASTSSASGYRAMSTGGSITVTVQENTSIKTTISANGTFELEGLPAGTFTLVFSSNGVTLGTITITSVPTQGEVSVVVQITATTVVLVKVEVNGTDTTTDNETKTCLINGGRVGEGIELEGSVSSASGKTFKMSVNGERADGSVSVDATSASFDCAGIKGTCDATLLMAGAKVHVSGTLTSCSLTAAQVKATQVKFQH